MLPSKHPIMKPTKPYWQMNTAELQEATKEFDEEFVILKSKPLSPEMQAKWDKARRKKPAKPKSVAAGLSVSVQTDLLSWLTAQAKKKNLSRSRFVADLLASARTKSKP